MTTAFLALDYMIGIADQAYSLAAVKAAQSALDRARTAGHLVVFSKVGYRAGHPEVSSNNKVFGRLLGTDQLVGDKSQLVDSLAPSEHEPIVDKKRISAFAGSGLWTILRARQTAHAVICGLSTSGVVLSTALDLIDADFSVTVLSDACADPEQELHDAVMRLLGSRCTVSTAADWIAGVKT